MSLWRHATGAVYALGYLAGDHWPLNGLSADFSLPQRMNA